MKPQKFKTVFDAYPDAQEIYVVNGMPFLERDQAANYASGNDRVELLRRADACGEPEPPSGDGGAQTETGDGKPEPPSGDGNDKTPNADPPPTIDAVAAKAKKGGKAK